MSSDHRQRSSNAPATGLACSFCDCQVTERVLALQSYVSEGSYPEGIPHHGGLTLCPTCAGDVVELVAAWDGHDHPAIAADRSIGAGYREVTDDCSFCGDGLGADPVLGIELYRRVDDELPAYANYTLCHDCQGVFGEFLTNVRGAVDDT